MAAGLSSSVSVAYDRSTTDGAEVDVGTIEGEQSVYLMGSGKPDPPHI